MRRFSGFFLLSLGCAYLAALMLWRLESFPGLHMDEAWIGILAANFLERGVYTLHGMNGYTGSLYAWILSKAFAGLGVSVFALRLPGAFLNAAAACILVAHLARRLGRAEAWAVVYLMANLGIFALKSRVAWEVYALQNFLLAVLLVLLREFIEEKRFSPTAVALFLAAAALGVFNHFIFASVPLSLAVAASALALEGQGWKLAVLCAIAAIASAFICALKPLISDPLWSAHRAGLAAALLATPLAAAILFQKFSLEMEDRIKRFTKTEHFQARRLALIKGILAIGLFCFTAWHLIPFIAIWSNTAIFKRLSSWEEPWLLAAASWAWAAGLLWLVVSGALGALDNGTESSPYRRFLQIWPLAYASLFILFRDTSSIRYYIIPSFLAMTGAAAAIPAFLKGRGRRWLAPGLALGAAFQGLFWREIGSPHARPPLSFRLGWHGESSADFLPKDGVAEAMARDRVCRIAVDKHPVDLPLFFLLKARRYECDESKTIAAGICPDCASPPYLRWKITVSGIN
ncbi:MAG: hypothetical protein HY921_03210 [Elusimicrobia bacterium]|nr:hypothetical protein [Elusimicrobiota bacterium]